MLTSASKGSAAGSAREVVLGAALMIFGCCANNITFEYLMRYSPTCGNLLTLSQFVFIAGEGLLVNLKRGERGAWLPRLTPRAVPLGYHGLLVVLFFAMSTLNNKATGYQISVPLHMTFRSGSLLTSLILGVALLGKRYSRREIASVALVTVGILLVTLATARAKAPPVRLALDSALPSGVSRNDTTTATREQVTRAQATEAQAAPSASGEQASDGVLDLMVWLVGLGMLATTTVLSSLLGIVQEWVKTKFGKDTAREMMFYSHLLSVPMFALAYSDVVHHIHVFNSSPPAQLPATPLAVPVLWLALACNVALQYVCVRGVYLVYGASSALTATLIMTVRKFLSLLLSIWLFGNAFTWVHWVGSLALFVGSLCYTVDVTTLWSDRKVD